MKVKKHNIVIAVFLLIIYLMQITACGTLPAQNGSSSTQSGSSTQPQNGGSSLQGEVVSASPYWTGDGARNDSIAILPLAGQGLSGDEERIPVTVQGILVGDMSGFSAMRVVDRMNLEKIIAEGESGYWADEKNFAQLGQNANVRYLMNGSIQKTGSGFVLQLRVYEIDGTSRAVYTQNCRLEELENQSAVKLASVYLLEQLGVKLTAAGQEALMAPVAAARIQADNALARGIIAQRQGTEIAALSYYFQASAYDPSLLEALNRSSILNANISSGNIGEDVRNDIIWRRNWVQRLTETEQSFVEFNRTTSMPYTLFYSDEIKQGAVDYQRETVTLSIETNLHPNHTWGRTVAVPMQRTLRSVYDGLQATSRTGDWGLNRWPNQRVTNLNSFDRRNNSFTIEVELLNDQNRVIGRQSFRADGWWEYTYSQNAPTGVRISDDVRRTVNFTVKADDISNSLTIRIASVNGTPAETAARNGVLQIRAVPKAEYDQYDNYRISNYQFALGEISGYSGNSRTLVIPSTVWGETVVGIGNEAFVRKQLTDVTIQEGVAYIGESAFANNQLTSVTIPSSVTSIGANAFANNQLTSVTIHEGLTTIGESAFYNNKLTSVTIPNSVTSIGASAFANNNDINRIIIGANVNISRNAFVYTYTWSDSNGRSRTENYFFSSYYDRPYYLAENDGRTVYYEQGRMAGQYDFVSLDRWRYRTLEQAQVAAVREQRRANFGWIAKVLLDLAVMALVLCLVFLGDRPEPAY